MRNFAASALRADQSDRNFVRPDEADQILCDGGVLPLSDAAQWECPKPSATARFDSASDARGTKTQLDRVRPPLRTGDLGKFRLTRTQFLRTKAASPLIHGAIDVRDVEKTLSFLTGLLHGAISTQHFIP